MLFSLYYCLTTSQSFLIGELWGIGTYWWFIFSILAPIVHQFYVLICWRAELHFKSLSKLFGARGFNLFKKGFAFLILSRPVTIILLAIANAMTANINPALSYIISVILFIPGVYLFYSLRKYFGIKRAFGIDHFEPKRYSKEPMIKQGIFKYSANAMYVFGFLVLWIPGILLQSKAALLIALFNHIYIWVHYYFTEVPDMRLIYNKGNEN